MHCFARVNIALVGLVAVTVLVIAEIIFVWRWLDVILHNVWRIAGGRTGSGRGYAAVYGAQFNDSSWSEPQRSSRYNGRNFLWLIMLPSRPSSQCRRR